MCTKINHNVPRTLPNFVKPQPQKVQASKANAFKNPKCHLELLNNAFKMLS